MEREGQQLNKQSRRSEPNVQRDESLAKYLLSLRTNVRPLKNKKEIPQADDVNKISEFPLRVSEGYDTADKIKHEFGFVNRQSSYYRHASEILGLVSRDKRWRYKLTDIGEEYLRLSSQQKSRYLCKLLLEFPINYYPFF